jgi:hypothetical protein
MDKVFLETRNCLINRYGGGTTQIDYIYTKHLWVHAYYAGQVKSTLLPVHCNGSCPRVASSRVIKASLAG